MVAERMWKRLNVKRRFCGCFVGLSSQKRDIIGPERSDSRKQINNVNKCLEEFYYRNQQTVKYFTCQLLPTSHHVGTHLLLKLRKPPNIVDII